MTHDLLGGLNPQQRDAVTAGAGPVLVLAGPGSGKTRVLTHRIAWLIQEEGVSAWQIMAVTFTNKAASEMRARVERLLDGRLDGLQIGTFHALCARILRREADHTPYRADFVIFDTDDQLSLIKQALAEQNVDSKRFTPGRVLNAISANKNELITPEKFSSRDYFTEVVGRVYTRYQALLVQNNALDFDDLLMQTVVLFEQHDAVRERHQHRIEHILVDEFQDTNTAQYRLVELLAKPQDNVLVVGDEDQGIYAFRGADYRNVLRFRQDYPDARVILLEQNYRSTQVVLDAARAVIDKNRHRTPKALFTDRAGGQRITIYEAYSEQDEGDWIANRIKTLRRDGYNYRDIGVMYRTNAQSAALERAISGANIPYRLIGGVAFYKRREIRDLLAYMRLVNNPDDMLSFLRVVNVPGRGIGKKSQETFTAWAEERGMSIGAALDALVQGEASPLTGKAVRSLIEFGRLLADLRALRPNNDLVALLDEITTRTGYNLYVNEISDTPEEITERLENITALRAQVIEFREWDLTEYLAETSLVSDVDTLREDKDAVTLLTLHAAKGLEYPVVFISGLEEGLLPHSRSIDSPDEMAEERRLLYVGLTRAKDRLYLTYAFRRMIYGDSTPGLASRFLGDIPASLTEGESANTHSLRDRNSYRRQTSWDRDDSSGFTRTPTPSARPSYSDGTPARSKVIPFRDTNSSSAEPPRTRFRANQKVKHAKYGVGTVIASRPKGSDEEVDVMFPQIGVKTFFASFANLVVVSTE